jgi:hypothetical protein
MRPHQVCRVKEFHTVKYLTGQLQHRLERKLPIALFKQVLKTRTQQVHNQHIVCAARAIPMYLICIHKFTHCTHVKVIQLE